MKIEIVAHIIDSTHGNFVPGQIAEVPDEIAAEWLNNNLALPHKEGQVETASAGAPEKATGTRQRQDAKPPEPPKT